MPEHTTTNWDRHSILAEIKRRHGSLKEFALQTPVTASDLSVALDRSYLKAEQAIAAGLGIPVQLLWPDRYWPNGRRRLTPTRPQRPVASQNEAAPADVGQAR